MPTSTRLPSNTETLLFSYQYSLPLSALMGSSIYMAIGRGWLRQSRFINTPALKKLPKVSQRAFKFCQNLFIRNIVIPLRLSMTVCAMNNEFWIRGVASAQNINILSGTHERTAILKISANFGSHFKICHKNIDKNIKCLKY